MPRRFFIMLVVAATAIAISQAPSPATQPTSPRIIVKERVVERVVKVPGLKPDGYMTDKDCRELPFGESLRDVLYRFGWPAATDTTEALSSRLVYPLREDHALACSVDIWRGEVDAKVLDLDSTSQFRMERQL
jgi:hypothetical protein